MAAPACRPSDAAQEGTLITVIVGHEDTEFKVYKMLLVHYSEYFERCLNGRWAEAQTGIVRIKEVDCITFEIFVNWIYSQKLPAWDTVLSKDCDCHDNAHDKKLCNNKTVDMCWTKAYCFANRFQAARFKKAVYAEYLHEEVNVGNGPPFFSVINYAFANLQEDDVLLKLLVDLHCLKYKPGMDNNEESRDRNNLPNAFVVRMMYRYSTVISENIAKKRLKAGNYPLHSTVLEG